MLRYLLPLLLLVALLPYTAATAQDDTSELTETYTGRGRLNDVTLNYPDGWHTLNGIPVNRLVSFNVISSVKLGLRNGIEPGEEAIVLAVAGGRIDRWGTLEKEATPEEVLNAFIEQVGDNDRFGGGNDSAEGMELVTEDVEFNGYEAVRMRFVPGADAAPEADDGDSDFVAYAVLLDDNQFMAVLTLTSALSFEDAQPTIEGILDSVTFEG
ncbi:MAG: hypothetical protein AAF787_08330 [Chloroflexota bacterium]